MRTLFRGGRVYTPVDPTATALLVDGDRIAWLGPDTDAPVGADTVVELDGALVTPAFVDAHVHTTSTGITLSGLDLASARSAADVLAAVAAHAATLPADAVVLGHGWDESGWADRRLPDAAELDVAGGGRAVYLSRIDVHAALVSSGLLTEPARAAAGFDASGWLRRAAHHVAREAAMGSISAAQRAAAQQLALRHAASLGIAAVHECGGPGTSSEDDFTDVLALAAAGGLPAVYGYWGELLAADKAKQLGALGAGGDLYADGALGSRTAYLRESYVDEQGACGHAYLDSAQVTEHLLDCAKHGMQGGFHAIGDGALANVLAGFAGAAATLGQDRVRAGRHRIEHAELLDKALIAQLVEFGVVASVQPAFDRLWGGDTGMYAQRMGAARSLASNPIASLAGVGVGLAFGSDSPVTPLDPWGSCLAAMRHHNPVQRIGARAAFAAHSRGGWRAAGQDEQGVLNPGWPATFAVWHCPAGVTGGMPTLVPAEPDAPTPPLPTALRTVLNGQTIFEVG